jgi:uncharacterized membrane protein YgaE (UPF0421/DUF939 family)
MAGLRTAAWLPDLQLALRVGVAAGLSIALASALRLEFPIYAMIAAVIVTDLSPRQTRALGLQRLVGTVLGAGLGALVCSFGLSGSTAIGASICIALFLCQLLRLQGTARLAAYVCGIVMLEFSAQPWEYAAFRLVETVLGVVTAVAVSAVPLLIRIEGKGEP